MFFGKLTSLEAEKDHEKKRGLRDLGGPPKIGGKPPEWMVKIMENPIKMNDLGVPLFLETPTFELQFGARSKQFPKSVIQGCILELTSCRWDFHTFFVGGDKNPYWDDEGLMNHLSLPSGPPFFGGRIPV